MYVSAQTSSSIEFILFLYWLNQRVMTYFKINRGDDLASVLFEAT